MDVASTCGSLVIGGFAGPSLPPAFERALRERRRGGVIFFKSNVEGGPLPTAALSRQVHDAAPEPPLVGIDQEGGRVVRLRAPLLEVPPMRTVASWGDVGLAERIARAVGAELCALGITIDFAPVLDVNTCPHNPIIGDRAFGDDAETCARFGVAWTVGLQSAGVLACGKHFPGHGDTSKDSHLDLPVVDQPRERIARVELAPFRAAIQAGVAAIMTAHVVYPALDPDRPATFSQPVCRELRELLGFQGLLVSDDLEMRAISDRFGIDEAAVLAVAAGCDALLICSSQDNQERAFEALVREAQRSDAFRARCEEACARCLTARKRGARPRSDSDLARMIDGPESRAVAAEMARAISRRSGLR